PSTSGAPGKGIHRKAICRPCLTEPDSGPADLRGFLSIDTRRNLRAYFGCHAKRAIRYEIHHPRLEATMSVRRSPWSGGLTKGLRTASAALALGAVSAAPAAAQLFQWSPEQLIKYTGENPFERFPDGRPKVPDDLLVRLKELIAEEVQ